MLASRYLQERATSSTSSAACLQSTAGRLATIDLPGGVGTGRQDVVLPGGGIGPIAQCPLRGPGPPWEVLGTPLSGVGPRPTRRQAGEWPLEGEGT